MNATTTPTYRSVTVTPDLAREWMKRNVHNRPLNDKRVRTFANAMLRGEWQENGDAIRFSVSGVLLDGQHRLAAVAKANTSIRALVAENLPDESQMTMDVGQTRSFAQVLTLKGYKDGARLAMLARAVYNWETGQVRNKNNPPTYAQMLHIVETNTDSLIESISVARTVKRHVPTSLQVLALGHWVFSAIGPEDVAFFFDRLRDGQNLQDGSPILAFRKWAILDAAKNFKHVGVVHVLALLIKSWNAYRDGTEIRQLAWRSGGASPEPFPEPK